jgi:hypothetical protein
MLKYLQRNGKTVLTWLTVIISTFLLFSLFIFHDFYSGGDELRTTYVAKEIATRGYIFYNDPNNYIYNTNIFVKSGFFINNNKLIYPVGFLINSLILVPILTFASNERIVFNLFAYLNFIISLYLIYKVFIQFKLSKNASILGALIFCLSNFYLALYVSYYPDFLLITFTLLFIYLFLNYINSPSTAKQILLFFISAFIIAYKITMFPAIFTFYIFFIIYLYRKDKSFKKVILNLFIISLFLLLFNFPQLYIFKLGTNYSDLTPTTTTQNINSNRGHKESIANQIEHAGYIFYFDFLLPKGNGYYLMSHIEKDLLFFGSNNMFVIFGFTGGLIFLFRRNKTLFYLCLCVFITSFILWGNMNTYGGSDDFDLRNSHIRYMLPVFLIFYILGYYYLQYYKNKYLIFLIAFLIVIRTFISLTGEYPFINYSLINQNGFFYNYYLEKQQIVNLNIPRNVIFISASFDDYDLSYYFSNYANLTLLANSSKDIHSFLSGTVKKNRQVYLLFPINDSRYNPFTQNELNSLYTYLTQNYKTRSVFEDNYKNLLLISKK